MPFQIIRNDITKVKADAIVNTANPDVEVGGGVDYAIYQAAGREQLLAERAKVGRLEVGQVAITPAFNLDAKYIIHSSGPWYMDGKSGELETLRQCYDKCLSLACEHDCESIAFPLMATGTYGFPKEIGMQIAVDAFTDFLKEHDMDITLVVYTGYAHNISGKWVDEVRDYVGDYTDNVHASPVMMDAAPMPADGASMPMESASMPMEDAPMSMASEAMSRGTSPMPMARSMRASTDSLEDMLKDIYTDSFEKHLQQLINKKGLKNSEVYTDANISKQYFSKLMKGQVKPSKEKVLSLAVGLHLNLDETIDFLSLAGYALSPISQTDKIVEYHIVRGEYSVMKINIVLFDYGLPMLSEY